MNRREAVRILGEPSGRIGALMKIRLHSHLRHTDGRTGWCDFIDYDRALIGVLPHRDLEDPRNWSPA